MDNLRSAQHWPPKWTTDRVGKIVRSRHDPRGDERYNIEIAEEDPAGVARAVTSASVESAKNVTYQGRVGESVEEILEEADRRDARSLIIGERKRTPVGKAIFGSITQSILLNASLPVMTVMHEE